MARRLVAGTLGEGGTAVDLTVGNGHDTGFLARAVGRSGRVLGIDVQPEAVAATRARLRASGLDEPVELVIADHADLAALLDAPAWRGRAIDAAMANLGYLPGGPREVVTRPESTVAALGAAVARLAPGGILTVVIYTGHPGGAEEGRAVTAWMESLDRARFHCARFHPLNADRPAPELAIVWRTAE